MCLINKFKMGKNNNEKPKNIDQLAVSDSMASLTIENQMKLNELLKNTVQEFFDNLSDSEKNIIKQTSMGLKTLIDRFSKKIQEKYSDLILSGSLQIPSTEELLFDVLTILSESKSLFENNDDPNNPDKNLNDGLRDFVKFLPGIFLVSYNLRMQALNVLVLPGSENEGSSAITDNIEQVQNAEFERENSPVTKAEKPLREMVNFGEIKDLPEVLRKVWNKDKDLSLIGFYFNIKPNTQDRGKLTMGNTILEQALMSIRILGAENNASEMFSEIDSDTYFLRFSEVNLKKIVNIAYQLKTILNGDQSQFKLKMKKIFGADLQISVSVAFQSLISTTIKSYFGEIGESNLLDQDGFKKMSDLLLASVIDSLKWQDKGKLGHNTITQGTEFSYPSKSELFLTYESDIQTINGEIANEFLGIEVPKNDNTPEVPVHGFNRGKKFLNKFLRKKKEGDDDDDKDK